MSTQVQVRTNTVPANFCFNGFNTPSWNELISLLYILMPDGYGTLNFGQSPPAPDERDAPWFRLNSDNTPDQLYAYQNGVWIARHAMSPGYVMMWEGTEGSIVTLDGGDATAITDRTGAFWEKVAEMNAKIPMGPGTTANGTVITNATNAGADEVTLTKNQIADHYHSVSNVIISTGGTHRGDKATLGTAPTLNTSRNYKSDGTQMAADGAEAHPNIPPVYGIWFIRRTERLYYTVV